MAITKTSDISQDTFICDICQKKKMLTAALGSNYMTYTTHMKRLLASHCIRGQKMICTILHDNLFFLEPLMSFVGPL